MATKAETDAKEAHGTNKIKLFKNANKYKSMANKWKSCDNDCNEDSSILFGCTKSTNY